MASSAAQAYFASMTPAQQAEIQGTWAGQDRMEEWYQNALKAGAVPASISGGGGSAPGGAGWKPKNKAELQQYAASKGWSEDFARFDDATVQHWLDNYWDPAAGAFKSDKTTPEGGEVPGRFEKPSETPPGWEAWGEFARPSGGGDEGFGGGGGFGGGPGGAGGGYGYAGAPLLDLPDFEAPSYEEAMADPGYQFALKQGQGALERSAAAKGTLRSGGTLKDLMDYGQGMAAQQYGDVFDRAVTKYGLQTGAKQAEFAPLYGSWQTQYGGDLSKWTTKFGGDLQKYLQKEQNIYGLLSAPPISYGG